MRSPRGAARATEEKPTETLDMSGLTSRIFNLPSFLVLPEAVGGPFSP
jgi:hypothetical protein